MEDQNILLKMYEEQRTQARHHESQRISVTNILITLTVASLGLIGHLRFQPEALPLAVFLVVIGVYGLITTWKLYERSRYHYARSSLYRDKVDEFSPRLEVLPIKQKAVEIHALRFKVTPRLRLHWLWALLYLTIIAMGIACILAVVSNMR